MTPDPAINRTLRMTPRKAGYLHVSMPPHPRALPFMMKDGANNE